MIIPLERFVDDPEFRRLVLKHFPELETPFESTAGLIHMEMSVLEQTANQCIRAGNMKRLGYIYEFVGDLARHREELDPDIINAIHVSFLEGLAFTNRQHGEPAKALLPPVLLQMWKNQMQHNSKLGI